MELPPTLVINLSTRPDRWASIQNDFRSWNLPMERMNAVQKKPGWKGCTLSHKKCIQIAKERNYPWLLILEDDAVPTNTGHDQFMELLPILWQSRDSWDIFTGGVSTVHNCTLLQKSPPLFHLTGWGSQFCLINSRAYDRLINTISDNLQDEHTEALDNHYNKDLFYMIGTYPQISFQKTGQSDVADGNRDFESSFRNANNTLYRTLLLNNEVLITTILLSLSITLCGLVIFRKRK
jgi:glycosyl transferase family 25